jgi:hypothetical protein
MYIKDLKVGDAPQTQVSFGTTLYPVQGLDINVSYNYFRDYYAAWDPFSRQDPTDDEESWQIPAYGIMDLHLTYQLPTIVNGFDVAAYAHIFNLLDEVYILEAVDNSQYNSYDTDLYPHTGSAAEVFFGLPRTFNAGLQLSF